MGMYSSMDDMMIRILTTLSCVMVASCIVAVALYMCRVGLVIILGLLMIWNWLTCGFTDENDHLKDVYDPFKDIVVFTLKNTVVVIHFEFFCLVISHLCIKFSSI
jgi:hypothetical protein